ncbi:MAG: hypothetical protein M1825_004496 [Sarcosagium campestre]|nr:MAG: hypothetical protein M1825_004496 [Sarcosagium campestre]
MSGPSIDSSTAVSPTPNETDAETLPPDVPTSKTTPPAEVVPSNEAPTESANLASASAGETASVTEPAKENGSNGSVKGVDPKEAASENQKPHHHTNISEKRKAQRRQNIKLDASSLPISDDHDEIRKQVEFYFSDSNLPADRFLLSQVGGVSNNPVKISVIHSFRRMKHFQPFEAIVAALKESSVLEVTDDECVKRKTPIDASLLGSDEREGRHLIEDKNISRSIYAKGFGEEQPTTQFDVEAFFAPYGPINAIRLRRTYSAFFKGSVFVEFADEATQKSFMALEPKPKWKGNDLIWLTKKAYIDSKAEDIRAGRIVPGEKWREHNKGGDPNDWKKRRAQDQKNGFRDNRGGRGGRGSRGSGARGGRRGDRNGGYANKDDWKKREHPQVPKLQHSEPEPGDEAAAPSDKPSGSNSRKRAREEGDDGETEKGASPKRADTKDATPAVAPVEES